ncbi:DMT family transporter [Leptospira fletcheri]|uniref:DMT family transporter n=1 Tax=Leptospira fletcheri TaxID=2484981 RepID=A0A4R9GJU0_9LEPT|nr:DMT family transporter [Leptospira fletcheri]TGK12383.1 DMT family transporter [Leptospira fletcheri]
MQSIKPYVFLVFFALITGTTFHVAKEALSFFSPSLAGALRFVLATFFLFSFVFFTDRKLLKVDKRTLIVFVALGIIGVFGFNFFFFLGMKKASPMNAAIVVAVAPAIAIFLSYFLLKTRIRFQHYLGTLISFIGVMLVISDGSISALIQAFHGEGILFILTAATCWSFYSVGMKKFIPGVSTIQTTAFTALFGTIALLVLTLVNGDWSVEWKNAPGSAWYAILYMAAFSTFVGYLCWNYGIQAVGPDKAVIFGNLIPVVAMLTSWILGETPNVFDLGGAFLVIFGIFIVNTKLGFVKMSYENS